MKLDSAALRCCFAMDAAMRRGQRVRAGGLCPRALQGSLRRSFARLEHLGDLGRSETEYVARHEHRPVSRRQLLEAATNASETPSLSS